MKFLISLSKLEIIIFDTLEFVSCVCSKTSCFKKLILEHAHETNSKASKIIISNFDQEIKNFIQVCPKEMIDKLQNPITLKSEEKKIS